MAHFAVEFKKILNILGVEFEGVGSRYLMGDMA